MLTLNDLAGGMLNPHIFCKPIVKKPDDREALLNLALDAYPKVMFGSDSAPHQKELKHCHHGAAGVFTSPFALQILTQLFETYGKLENLNKFLSLNAQKIYNFKAVSKKILLEKKDFFIPQCYRYKDEKVVPLFAGEKLSWTIKKVYKES